MAIKVIGILLMGLWLATDPALAEITGRSPIAADTLVNPRQVTVGDIVTYSIVVQHDEDIHVAPPDPTAHFKKGFDLVDKGTSEPKNISGQKKITFWFKFRADRVGLYQLPKIPVQFTSPSPDDPSHPLPGILHAPKAVIEIQSVLFTEDDSSDIKDIKPIIGAGWNWLKYLKWGLTGLAILLAVAGFLWWLSRTKKVSQKPTETARHLTPGEIALAELDKLVSKQLLEKDRYQEHYFELSEIFRRYLGVLLSIPALDWTTEEIKEYVTRSGMADPGWRQIILDLLPATDQVKFAKAPVSFRIAVQHMDAVREFIRATTPEYTSKFQVKSPTAA